MQNSLLALKGHLADIADLNAAGSVLNWDQSTYMPPGGAAARGRQMATLGKIAQERLTNPELGRLLGSLRPLEAGLPADSDDASLIRVARREYERAVKVPPAFQAKMLEHFAATYQVWHGARASGDFKAVQPYLEKTLELSLQLADCFPGYAHPADPLIDYADYGMQVGSIKTLFASLREQLVPLVKELCARPPVDTSCLLQEFPQAEQVAFAKEVITQMGYDWQRGRMDLTPHPFMTRFSHGDVRITTRWKDRDLSEGLFSTIHEAGHALYEQGIRAELDATVLGNGVSSGVHESQSRLWENLVGRSLGFWQHFYPLLQQRFPQQLGAVELLTFYRAINHVTPSLIRTDADEVTYNLHVMIRFDLECALLEGKLAIKDLPEAWNARYQSDLGVSAKTATNGVMQDVHWYFGPIGGAFQGYTIGNILSAQFYAAAVKAKPQIPREIQSGTFATLRQWLLEHVHQQGNKLTPNEVILQATGTPLQIEPYMSYLRQKFTAL